MHFKELSAVFSRKETDSYIAFVLSSNEEVSRSLASKMLAARTARNFLIPHIFSIGTTEEDPIDLHEFADDVMEEKPRESDILPELMKSARESLAGKLGEKRHIPSIDILIPLKELVTELPQYEQRKAA